MITGVRDPSNWSLNIYTNIQLTHVSFIGAPVND
jgi:hypothetical protein